jgi:putative oxidoreductase
MATTSSVDYELRRHVGVAPRAGLLSTSRSIAPTIARLALGLVMFPHGAQKMLGLWGGAGFSGTVQMMTSMGMNYWLVVALIVGEFLASIALIFGALTRLAAVGIAAIMVGAIVMVHAKVGFFMNWMGNKAGEGFEYHLLAIGLALVCFIMGGGAASVDRAIVMRRRREL